MILVVNVMVVVIIGSIRVVDVLMFLVILFVMVVLRDCFMMILDLSIVMMVVECLCGLCVVLKLYCVIRVGLMLIFMILRVIIMVFGEFMKLSRSVLVSRILEKMS